MDGQRLNDLLVATLRVGASALHLVPGRVPNWRVRRRFVAAGETLIEPSDVDDLMCDMLFSEHREQLDRLGYTDVLYVSQAGYRYRGTFACHSDDYSLVLRPVPVDSKPLSALALPDQVAAFTRCRQGFVAVGGSLGSGKSTTLAAIVDACNADAARHIVSIEDSIQVVHQNGAALLHQREVGTHVVSAAEGVRQAVAVGADVIVLAEVRDIATLDAVLTASESGCLVFAGVEASSVVGVVVGLTSLAAVEDRPRLRTRLAMALRGVTAQSLLRRASQDGRVPVVEIAVASSSVREAIRAGQLQDLLGIMSRCRGLGMQTLDSALRTLLNDRVITEEEALLHATNRDQVMLRQSVR